MMMFCETVTIYCQNNKIRISRQAEFIKVATRGTYNYHSALKS